MSDFKIPDEFRHEFDHLPAELPGYSEADFATQVTTPDNVGHMLTGILDHAEAVKQMRAELTEQIAKAQAVLAFTDDQFTITHHEVW